MTNYSTRMQQYNQLGFNIVSPVRAQRRGEHRDWREVSRLFEIYWFNLVTAPFLNCGNVPGKEKRWAARVAYRQIKRYANSNTSGPPDNSKRVSLRKSTILMLLI